jgi:putative sterol carrier protein
MGGAMTYQYGTTEWDEAYAKLIDERKKTETEPYILYTPEWVSEFEKKIQESGEYKQLAAKWEGSVTLLILADPEAGIMEDLYALMALWHGECDFARLVPQAAGENADYILRAEYKVWKNVLKENPKTKKRLDVVKAMMTPTPINPHLKVAKGDVGKLILAAPAAIKLVKLAIEVDMVCPDELSPERRESFKSLFAELRTEFGI